jgi:lipoprotein NlpI
MLEENPKASKGGKLYRILLIVNVILLIILSLVAIKTQYLSSRDAIAMGFLAMYAGRIYKQIYPDASIWKVRLVSRFSTIFIIVCVCCMLLSAHKQHRCSDAEKDPQTMIKVCTEALKHDPNEARFYIHRGTAHLQLNELTLGKIDFDESIRIAPANLRFFLYLGLAESRLQNNQAAIDDYNKALQSDQLTPELKRAIISARALTYVDLGDYEKAVEDTNDILITDPKSRPARLVQSAIHMNNGDYAAALNDVNHLTENDQSVMMLRGIAEYYGNLSESAITDFLKVYQLSNTDEEKVSHKIWLHLARLHTGQNDQSEMKKNDTMQPSNKWPFPLLALYRDQISIDDVLAASKVGAPDTLRDQACDADFYVGKYAVLKKQNDKAITLFQAAENDCPKEEIEYGAAKEELRILTK